MSKPNILNTKVVVSLSGGMDSTTLLCYCINEGFKIYPIIFKYGSKHNEYEITAALSICNKFSLTPKIVDLSYMNDLVKSNLLKSGGEIPEGHYEASSMEQTVVPGRNIIFIANMVGYAWTIGANFIAIGVHAGDHAIYSDCRPDFIKAMDVAVYFGSDGRVEILAPFQNLDKAGILDIGYNLDEIRVPYEITRTCYKDEPISCGKCGSCVERLEAFDQVNKKDPITYE